MPQAPQCTLNASSGLIGKHLLGRDTLANTDLEVSCLLTNHGQNLLKCALMQLPSSAACCSRTTVNVSSCTGPHPQPCCSIASIQQELQLNYKLYDTLLANDKCVCRLGITKSQMSSSTHGNLKQAHQQNVPGSNTHLRFEDAESDDDVMVSCCCSTCVVCCISHQQQVAGSTFA